MVLSSDSFHTGTEFLPLLTTFVNLEVLFVAVADDLYQPDTFVELCVYWQDFPNSKQSIPCFCNSAMDKGQHGSSGGYGFNKQVH